MPLCIIAKLALLDFFFSPTSGWSKGQTYDTSSREAAWRRMVPLLLCGGDRMKFRVAGRGVSELAVDQGKQAGLFLFFFFPFFCKVSIWLHRHVNFFSHSKCTASTSEPGPSQLWLQHAEELTVTCYAGSL